MKNLNLIKRLWTDSHEKQSPQRFVRYAAILIMLLTLGVGQMWAECGFENSNNGILFSRTPLGGAAADYRVEHGRTNSTQDAGTVSALTMKEWYAKLYQNSDCIWGDGNLNYRVYLQGTSAPAFTTSNKSYFNWNGDNCCSGYRYPTFGRTGMSVNVLSGLASGKYYFEYYWDASGSSTMYCNNGSTANFKITFNIKPAALTSFSVARSGYSAGSGTSEDPYIIARGGSLTLTASGSGGTSDANSTIKYKYGSSDWQTTSYTISGITSTTKASIVVKGARRHNSQDYGGDEKSVTIYYKAETTYSVTVTNGTPASVYAGASYTKPTITASGKTGYYFDHWSTTGGASVASTTTSPTTVTATATGTVTANYEPNTYNITLNKNGGDNDGSATITYLTTSFASHTAPEKEGYTVEGYYTNDATPVKIADANGNLLANKTGYTNASSQWTKTSDATLFAHWKQTYSVTYYANYPDGVATSGSVPTDANEYASGATVTVKSNTGSLAATGYTFTGWNTAPGGGGTSYAASGSATFSISGNTPLYAQWSENKTAVTISASPTGTGTFTVGGVSGTSASVGVTTTAAIVATAATDFQFVSWATTNCSVLPTNNRSTTLTGNGSSATGTLVATFTENVASGWYLVGNDFGDSWSTSCTTYPLTKKYRGMEGVFYRRATVSKDKYHCIHNGTYLYKPSSNTYFGGSGWGKKITLNSTSANANVRFSAAGTYYIVVDTRGTWPIIWYETSEPDRFNYHSVNVTGVENAKGTCKVNLGSTSGFETTRFANGETFYVTITGVSGYIPTITIGGVATTFWKEASSYSAYGTMSTSDIAVTISYTASRAVTFATTTGCSSLSATGPSSTAVTTGTKVKDGTVIRFAQTNSTGYTFSKWYSNSTGTDGTQYSASSSAYDLTISSTAYTIYPIYTENMTTVNLVASPTGKGTFTCGGDAVTSVSAGVTTHPAVTAVAGSGYSVNTSATVWSESSDYISLSSTTTNPTTITATGTSGNSATLTATFTPNPYTITLKKHNGDDDGSLSVTYDAGTNLDSKVTPPTKTGYTFGGYYTGEGGSGTQLIEDDGDWITNNAYIDEDGKWVNAGNVTLHAKWTANPYTVTLDVEEDNHGTIASADVSASVTYDAAPSTIANRPTAANGYALDGYYTDHLGEGTKVINGDGTWIASVTGYTDGDAKWVHVGDVTLYAYYKKAEITALTITPSTAGLGATVTVTPMIDPMPTGTYQLCWKLLRNNDNEITGTDFDLTSDPYDDPNTVQFTAPSTSGTYKVKCILRTGSSCDGGDELDNMVQSFTVAGEHTVTIRYQDASGRTLAASTEVTGRPLTWSEAIAAPSITGYTFARWEAGDGIILSTNGTSELGSNTTTTDPVYVKATYAGNLTAVYNKKKMIYFNNTLGWSDVYVYFYENGNYWSDTYGSGAKKDQGFGDGEADKPYRNEYHGHMTEIAPNIWAFDYSDASIPDKANVAFTEADQHKNQWFDNTKVVRVFDFNNPTTLPMYVPLTEPTEEYNKYGVGNKTIYYTKGYWMNYPENTGYTLKIYNGTGGSASELQSIPFEFTGDYTMPMSVTAELEAGRTYGYKIYRNDGSWFGNNGTMRNGASGDEGQTVWEFETGKSNCGLTTSAAGEYTFTLTYAPKSGTYYYLVGVHYPVAVGSYRLVYTDEATTLWSGHTKPANWYHPSRAIEKKDGAKDIISFYVSKETGANASIKVQYASAINASTGAITWADGTDATHTSVTLDLSSITSSGVYNFHLTQADGSISVEKIEAYTGNYYIRTDCAGTTKWDNYRAADHQMTYSEFSKDRATNTFGELYTHYYMHWCPRSTNIKFVIANDYSMCITDTLENDLVDWGNMSSPGWLDYDGANPDYRDKYSANIRFMYDERTNKISRAYMSSSTNTDRKFLVLKSNTEFKNSDGTALSGSGESKTAGNYEAIFKDNEDWIYEREIKLTPGQKFKLYASYAQATVQEDGSQHFRGNYADNDWENAENYVELVGGTGSACNARIVYDFKTNRLMSAYVPDNDNPIEGSPTINADIMIVRNHQDAGQQITFTTGSSLNAVKTVYGVMRFNRWILNNRQHPEDMIHDHSIDDSEMNKYHPLITDPGSQKSADERGLYWISFPFNVNLSEVFGFGTYGTHWIILTYNGEERAKQGYWADSEGFWEYIWDRRGVVLEKGKGYVLALELGLMQANNRTFWNNEIQQVELFFPSTTSNTGTIQETDVDIDVPAWQCTIDRTNSGGTSTDFNKNRTIADSHWNIIGVPSYANYNKELTDGSSTITWHDPETEDLPFLYEWNANDNTYTVQSGTNYPFKAMHSYYVQYHGRLHWSLASATPAYVASRSYAEAPRSEEFRLEFLRNDKMEDQTFVKLSDKANVSANFVFGEDMIKEKNATRANIYTIVENYLPVAGNTLPISEQTTVVPVGVKIAAEGNYTFSIPEGTDGIGITLVDNETGVRTLLSALDYTIHLEAGTYDQRFILEISPVKQMPTDIENVQGDNVQGEKARKVMVDGILYIVKDGKVFDARGAKVK